jgi:CheY-specific phosphatase CheX
MSAVSLRVTPRKSYVSISFRGKDGDSCEIPDFTDLIAGTQSVVVCCAGITELPKQAEEAVAFLFQQLKDQERKVSFAFAGDKLAKALARSPHCANIPQFPDLSSAIRDFDTAAHGTSSQQFIRAFVNATLRTLYVQCKTRCQRGQIKIKSEEKDLLLGDISGIVLAVGYAFSYAVVLSFPRETFLKLLSRMLDEPFSEINDANRDGASELMNIVYAQAKRVLNEKGAGLEPQIPILNEGRECSGFAFPENDGHPTRLDEGKMLVIPFEAAEIGKFYIEIWFPAGFSPEWLS